MRIAFPGLNVMRFYFISAGALLALIAITLLNSLVPSSLHQSAAASPITNGSSVWHPIRISATKAGNAETLHRTVTSPSGIIFDFDVTDGAVAPAVLPHRVALGSPIVTKIYLGPLRETVAVAEPPIFGQLAAPVARMWRFAGTEPGRMLEPACARTIAPAIRSLDLKQAAAIKTGYGLHDVLLSRGETSVVVLIET